MTTYLGTEVLIRLLPHQCKTCGVNFGFDETWVANRKEDHETWWCPNGHQWHWPAKNDLEVARAELEAARSLAQREANRRREAESRQEHTERRRRAAVGQVTKIKRRVGRGVCPCCNRTFADLGRHMSGQHPEFAGETELAQS